jgi:hypothetical protein
MHSYVALPLITKAVGGDLVAHLAVHEDAQLALIFDFEELLGAILGEADLRRALELIQSRS